MNRSVHNRGSKAIEQASFFWRVGRAGLTAFLWFLLVLAFFTGLAALSHAQKVDLSGVPGSTIAAKVNWVQNDSTSSYCITGGVCQLYAGPELANIPTGTLPTMASGVYLLDARSASSGLRYAATGTNALSNFGSTFTGGAITSAITGANGACSSGNVTYSYTSDPTQGWYFDTTFGMTHCAAGTDTATFLLNGTGLRMRSAFVQQWTSGVAKSSTITLETSQAGVGLFGIGQVNGEVDAKVGGKTNCDGPAASTGVFCYDRTLQKWRCSENNGALANCFAGAGAWSYNGTNKRWELFDSTIATWLQGANPGYNLEVNFGTCDNGHVAASIAICGGNSWRLNATTITMPIDGVQVATSAVANNVAAISMGRINGTSPGAVIQAGNVQSFWVEVDSIQSDANTTQRVGLLSGTSDVADPPTDGVFLERLGADTNWFLVTRASSTQTRCDTTIAHSATQFSFVVVKTSTTNVSVFIPGTATAKCSNTTNIPANATALSPIFQSKTLTTAAKSLKVLHFQLVGTQQSY